MKGVGVEHLEVLDSLQRGPQPRRLWCPTANVQDSGSG